jgi:hypothetical protein
MSQLMRRARAAKIYAGVLAKFVGYDCASDSFGGCRKCRQSAKKGEDQNS